MFDISIHFNEKYKVYADEYIAAHSWEKRDLHNPGNTCDWHIMHEYEECSVFINENIFENSQDLPQIINFLKCNTHANFTLLVTEKDIDNAKHLLHSNGISARLWTINDDEELIELNILTNKIVQWGKCRGILDSSSPTKQFYKLLEEVNETGEAIESMNTDDIKDGIGDCTVVLILLAQLCGTTIQECLNQAYNEIKDRKGKMLDGFYVKENHK